MKKILRLLFAAALVVSVVSCSGEKKVGSGIDVDKLAERNQALGGLNKTKEGEEAGGFVGQKEQKAEEQARQQEQNAAVAEQEAAVKQQKEDAAVAFAITASGYDPYVIRVFVGGVVSVTNRFTKTATVTADRGEFDSGPLAPGESWTYEPKTPGKYNFHDEGRPFVVGTLEVLAR
jgi:plastocyanin